MKNTRKKAVIFFLLALSIGACNKEKNKTVEGLKPIYATEAELQTVEVSSSQPLINPGRIYIYNHLLLVNEQAKGIHIYDNSNIESPSELSFISIPGNMDFSVKQNLIYADNVTDMIVIDISHPNQPTFKSRIRHVFPVQQFPSTPGYFECVDPSKGLVVGWEKTKLENPTCSK